MSRGKCGKFKALRYSKPKNSVSLPGCDTHSDCQPQKSAPSTFPGVSSRNSTRDGLCPVAEMTYWKICSLGFISFKRPETNFASKRLKKSYLCSTTAKASSA